MRSITLPLLVATVNALIIRQEASTCSIVSEECTSIAQLQQATYYCASVLGTPITTTTRTKTITVAPSCGTITTTTPTTTTTITPALEKRQTATTTHSLCFTPSNSAEASAICSCFSLPSIVTTAVVTRAKATGPFSITASGGTTDGDAAVGLGKGNLYVGYNGGVGDKFLLDHAGNLIDESKQMRAAFEFADPTGDEPVLLARPSDIASNGWKSLQCAIRKNTCALDCTVNGDSNNYQCYGVNQWYISPSPISGGNCAKYQPIVVY